MSRKIYETIYDYYVELMESKKLNAGEKMPSLRTTCANLNVSRTSAETAYIQLAADGYIYSVEKVGYFVTDLVEKMELNKREAFEYKEANIDYKYDFATIKQDASVSCLDLWRRYMKSALRQEERLLSYGINQGEEDLREEIASYVRRHRNIICSASDIVIGAGFQNLLQVLVPLIDGEKTVSFPTKNYKDGATAFSGAGYEVSYRNKQSHVIYVTPAYMTKWGEVMTMQRRRELLDHGRNNGKLIIEDDYQNEFVFSSHATPSLYALSAGEGVAYLSSFSRALLPSVRISFLILPKELKKRYEEIGYLYNQTASKAEQIALAQFLRDGHLQRHIKKMRRLYEEKREILARVLEKSTDFEILLGDSGMEIGVILLNEAKDIKEKINKLDVDATVMETKDGKNALLLSCSGIDRELIEEGVLRIRDVI